jgi:hypothetical protein
MRFITPLVFVVLLCSAHFGIAQNVAANTVFVSKDFVIKTNPRNADIIAINSNGGEVKLGNDTVELHADKSEAYTIEVRKDGYQSVRKIYTRQKGGLEEDMVELPTRVVKINVSPADARVYVDNVSLNGTSPEAIIQKGQSITVDVKYPGYVTQTQVFYNKPGEAEPEITHFFKLQDRMITVKAVPKDASIMVNGKKAGQGTADVVIKKDSCVNVLAERVGYASKSVSYCNKDNEGDLNLSDEIQLKDRVAQINVQPEGASISVDGREVGKGNYAVNIPEGKCVDVFIQYPGYAPVQQSLCNKPDVSQPEANYAIKMPEDEAYTQSEESSIANVNFGVEVNPSLSAPEAWKKLCSIIQTFFDEIESQDATTSYLRTNWVASIPFNLTSPYPRIIRTRVVITSGGSSPLKYNIKIQSEVSRMGKDCKPEGMKYPPVSRDDCFDAFPRIFRKYKDLVSEVQARLQ